MSMCCSILRAVFPFATAHRFCASRDGLGNSGFLTAVPARLITTYEKQILARVIGIRKEN